jgi:outer membrane lipoprotein SlyB
MNKVLIVSSVIAAISLSGCARRVVVDPNVVHEKNAKDWTVKNEPQKSSK